MTAQKNSKVKVHYVGSLDDGTVFDKSTDGEPLEFILGTGQIIPGFEQAVEGMKVNEEKKVTIKPQDAYGERNDKLIKEFPKESLPADFKPALGMIITLHDQAGMSIPATIISMDDVNIKLDLNHPLAGKSLIFDIKVLEIQ